MFCGASVAGIWTVRFTSRLVTPNLEAYGSPARRKNLAHLRHKHRAHYPLAGPLFLFLTYTCQSSNGRSVIFLVGNRLLQVDLLIILFRTFQSHPWPVFFYSSHLAVGLTIGRSDGRDLFNVSGCICLRGTILNQDLSSFGNLLLAKVSVTFWRDPRASDASGREHFQFLHLYI